MLLDAAILDRDDPLALARERFELPDGVVYLDGNSLGPLLRGVRERVRRTLDVEWGRDLIRSWNVHRWIDLPRTVAAKIAPIVGAGADEVLVADSTSIDLFKLLAAGLELRPGRRTILASSDGFPSDLYVAGGLASLRGDARLSVVPREGIAAALDDDVAVLCLSHVDFRTGALLDLPALTAAAHAAGALACWDLSHSAGVVPVDLDGDGVDLAVGCGYKFLNGGPGAPAWLFVARRHQEAARSPLAGWLGHAAPFAFEPGYRPAPGIDRFLCGTPPILSLAALDAALDAYAGIDLSAVRRKSIALGDRFISRVRAFALPFEIASPLEGPRRGSQVSLRHPDGYSIVQALAERGVIADFREPDVLRFGLAPLYLRFADVDAAVAALSAVVAMAEHGAERHHVRAAVT